MIAMSLAEQGNVRRAQERWAESFKYHYQACTLVLKIFGRGHFRTAALAAKLGQHYQRRGDLVQAKSVYIAMWMIATNTRQGNVDTIAF